MANKFGEFGSTTGGSWETNPGVMDLPDMPEDTGGTSVPSAPVSPYRGGGGLVGKSALGAGGAGGSYGLGGLGADLKYTAAGADIGLAGGGAVPDMPVDEAEGEDLTQTGDLQRAPAGPSGQPDLNSALEIVQQLLRNTRQQFGIPSGEVTPGSPPVQRFADGGDVMNPLGREVSKPGVIQDFEEGGEVEEAPEEAPAQQPQLLPYGAGAGAVSPDIARALEQRVDPDGSMDPNERTVRALAAAGQSGTGLLQHYRQKYNALTAFAKAALTGTPNKPGDIGASARAMTQAMQYVPDGKATQFIPTSRGIVMRSRDLAGGAQRPVQKFAEGGTVEDEEYANARTGLFNADDEEYANARTGLFQAQHPDDNKFAGMEGEDELTGGAGSGDKLLQPQEYKSFLDRLYDMAIGAARGVGKVGRAIFPTSEDVLGRIKREEDAAETGPFSTVRKAVSEGYGEKPAASGPPLGLPTAPMKTGAGAPPFQAPPRMETPPPPRASSADDDEYTYERTANGVRRVRRGEEAIDPELMRQAEGAFPRGMEAERGKFLSQQLKVREENRGKEGRERARGEWEGNKANIRGEWERDKAKTRGDWERDKAETSGKYRAEAARVRGVDAATVRAGATDRATESRYKADMARILARMNETEEKAITKDISDAITRLQGQGKLNESNLKAEVMNSQALRRAAAKAGMQPHQALSAIMAQITGGSEAPAEPTRTRSVGGAPGGAGAPRFQSMEDLRAAIQSGRISKGMKFRDPDGVLRTVP